jgi:hypothetical protein
VFQAPNIDGVLITCGEWRLYPDSRVAKVKPQPKLNGGSCRRRCTDKHMWGHCVRARVAERLTC